MTSLDIRENLWDSIHSEFMSSLPSLENPRVVLGVDFNDPLGKCMYFGGS